MFGNMEKQEDLSQNSPQPQNPPNLGPPPQALGVEAVHNLCNKIYPDQENPLTVTAIVKYWLGGPDPLDYISMYENPGCPELGIPPHWHYVSLGLSDLHGDGRIHFPTGPDQPSGYGFELTFRLVRQREETRPPTWPANVMQQLAKYVFNSSNKLFSGDHVSWNAPLDSGSGCITQILLANDPQFPDLASTPHGDVSFIQIVGVTSEELQAAQHWNGIGMINLLKTSRACGPWLVTDMKRTLSIMKEDPSIAERIRIGLEEQGTNLSGVSAICWWSKISEDGEVRRSIENLREMRTPTNDGEDIKPVIKSEKLSLSENGNGVNENITNDNRTVLPGIHLFFNLEAGSLLPLAVRGRLMHGHHFTFKSNVTHTAITLVPPKVTGAFVTREEPYVVKGPWLQVLIPENLAEKVVSELKILATPSQVQLPKIFSWPEHNLKITINIG